MHLKLVCHYILLLIFISAQSSSAVETYDDLYVGCYIDVANFRVLPDASSWSSEMTIELCIDYCTVLGGRDSAYAGVEFANECYCGVAGTNYGRYGVAEHNECNWRCGGDDSTYCGGVGRISIYNLLLIRPQTTNETSSSSVIPTSPDASTAFDNRTEESDESTTPLTTRSTKSVLYAGAGGGGAFLLILIIIIIVVVTCRRRNPEKRTHATEHPLTTMIPTKDGNKERSRPTKEEEDPCYENKSAETERDYENMTVDNNELTYMNSEKRSTMKEATHDPAALYAMPDMSAKTSSRPKTTTSPANDTDDPSLMYAMPDRRAKTVYSSNSKAALGEDNLHALYATSTKNRLEPIGMEASTDGEGLYALPNKTPRDHVTQNGAGKRDDVEAMYAMPDKSRRGNDVDNAVMIENDIYSST
ncbi:uncharacterized protein LOC105441919 isoform X2 [Strongylocentrotus purpuratus]|uniref:WSC domain-containing protein n=1 Tax=Strongylocentrotus purpuratus TaxID=7668 RepID=A0A7M7NNA9_STRPU|nr:uncharacterized protein LOC105441919 isoform X2 [Strongylocentrotus purpuratus]